MSTPEALREEREVLQARLGARLRELRQAQSLRKLEASTGLSRPTLVAVEKGADFQLSTLLKLLQAHGQLALFDALVEGLGEGISERIGDSTPAR